MQQVLQYLLISKKIFKEKRLDYARLEKLIKKSSKKDRLIFRIGIRLFLNSTNI
tara:strand:+ start:729 stop:890 length:162 start_codon:yes stop_codon:yes gene_type:complete